MALWQRDREGHPIVPGELIGHADAGSASTPRSRSPNTSPRGGIRPSIGSVADAYDNALMECVIGLYKTECIRTTVFHDGPYRTIGRRRVRHRRLGRLVQQPTPPQHLGYADPRGVRDTPTTRPSTPSRNPYESGTEPGALQFEPLTF
jgi:hypothetical protein